MTNLFASVKNRRPACETHTAITVLLALRCTFNSRRRTEASSRQNVCVLCCQFVASFVSVDFVSVQYSKHDQTRAGR